MDYILSIIVLIALVSLGVLLVLLILGATIFRKSIGHDIFGWHKCDMTGFDGASATGICKYCGKECLMDSQGNWF